MLDVYLQNIDWVATGILIGAIAALTAAVVYSVFAFRRYRRSLPTSYFVRYLSAEQINAMRQASIPFAQTTLFGTEDGVLFEVRYLKQVLRSLNANLLWQFAMGNDRLIHEIILHFKPQYNAELRQFSVTGSGEFYGLKSAVLKVVSETILPDVRNNIVVHAVGTTCSPINDDNFHIFLHASPPGAQQTHRPETVWHTPHNGSSYCYSPAGLGIPFIDLRTNFTVCELVDNCLYLHSDVLNAQNRRRRSTPRIVWDWFASFWKTRDRNVALIARILQQTKGELGAGDYLTRIVDELKAQGTISNETPDNRYKVTFDGPAGRRQDVIRSMVTNILVPVVNADISVHDCEGNPYRALSDGRFHIFIYSSPCGTPILDTPEHVWGKRLLLNGKAFAPSTIGVPIVDDAGFIVGELLDGNLYLHQKYVRHGTYSEAQFLAKLLVAVRNEVAAFGELTIQALETRLCSHFVDECTRQFMTVQGQTRNADAGTVAETLRQTQTDLQTNLSTTSAMQNELYRIESAPQEEAAREFDALLSMPKVEDVKVFDTYLQVATRTIFCVDPRTGYKHEIGAFHINIPFNRHENVVWKNRTRTVGGGGSNMNAPHVNSSGLACLGNMKDVFPMLIEKRDYAAAIEAAIAFVEAVNVNDSWGQHINRWPRAQ